MKKSKYNIIFKNQDNNTYIIYNTRTLGLAILSKDEYNILNGKYDGVCLEKKGVLDNLYECGFIIDDDYDELKILKNRLWSQRYSERLFRLTIAPTLNCNFNCPYCYEKLGETKDITIMNNEVQQKVVEFVKEKIQNSREASIIWYGGEPLLAFDVISNLSKKIMKICKDSGVDYTAHMVTNGYLLSKHKPEEFLQLNIKSIQVTLDGTEAIHNQRRALKSGEGTYQTILNNISVFSKKIHFTIRYNLDKNNNNVLREFIQDIKEKKLSNVEINLAPVTNYENPLSDNCYSTKEFANLWVKFAEMCKKNEINIGNIMIPPVSHYCDADSVNSYTIDHLGYIYKCWQDIGNIKLSVGNIKNSYQDYSALYFSYLTYDATIDEKCKECSILPICMGGCPYERVHNQERCCRYKYALEYIVKDMIKQK